MLRAVELDQHHGLPRPEDHPALPLDALRKARLGRRLRARIVVAGGIGGRPPALLSSHAARLGPEQRVELAQVVRAEVAGRPRPDDAGRISDAGDLLGQEPGVALHRLDDVLRGQIV